MACLRPLVSSRCLASRHNTLAAQSIRTFTTTQVQCRQTPTHLKVPFDQVPDYPYGPFRTYKQRNVGLYGTTKIRFGNTVSRPKGNNPKQNPKKEPTHWLPNRRTRRLWSEALDMFIRTRITNSVLKTVDKLGGIDNYLLGTKTRRIRELGPAGWRLRWKVMQSPRIQERWAREREALGLPPKGADMEADEAAPSEADMSVIDGMLAREEEFVLGEVREEEEFMREVDPAAAPVEEAREVVQEAVEELADEAERGDTVGEMKAEEGVEESALEVKAEEDGKTDSEKTK